VLSLLVEQARGPLVEFGDDGLDEVDVVLLGRELAASPNA
jgi:hypothetical protein